MGERCLNLHVGVFTQGVSLTAQRAAIVVGVELPVYDLTKKHLILSDLMGDTVYTHFLSGFTCGLAGALDSTLSMW